MIYYKRCLWSNLCSAPVAQQIRTFLDALIIAGLSTVVSLTVCMWVAYKPELRSVLEVEGAGYASFTSVLGLLTVFRLLNSHFPVSLIITSVIGNLFNEIQVQVGPVLCWLHSPGTKTVARSHRSELMEPVDRGTSA